MLKVRRETVDPLVADGDGGSQDQGWLAEAADKFQTENRFARTGSGDNVDAVILLQVTEAFEDALLIRPEGTGKAPAGLRLWIGRCHAGKSNRSGTHALLVVSENLRLNVFLPLLFQTLTTKTFKLFRSAVYY